MNPNPFYNFHPDKIGVVNTEYLNRSSTLFFYALMDGHPELICGFMDNIYPMIPSNLTLDEITLFSYELLHKQSSYWMNIVPYHFPFSLEEFINPFQVYLNKFGISNKNNIIAIHYAISVLLKKDISKIKWIILHTHSRVKHIMRTKIDFPQAKIIITVRDSRACAWSTKKCGAFPAYLPPTHAPTWFKYLRNIYGKDCLFIRHEDLHTNYAMVRNNLCCFLEIHDDKSFDEASYFNQPWDGTGKKIDFLSIKKNCSTRPNPIFVYDDWKNELSKTELFLIQKLTCKTLMEKFDYVTFQKKSNDSVQIPFAVVSHIENKLNKMGFLKQKTKDKLIKSYTFIESISVFSKVLQFLFLLVAIGVAIYWFTRDAYYFKKYYLYSVIKTFYKKIT
jgi:hypothetical protein